MNQQDELATPDEIEFWRAKAEEVGGVLGAHFHDALDRLVRASWSSRPRVVETIEELKSLPEGSVIRTDNTFPLEKVPNEFGTPWAYGAKLCTNRSVQLPATVLYLPEETP